ncbi:MAG: trypsin-like peptidase domain-containing protein [Planctomycetes bacterium]|nr:trypsin-like peptidase domain-containing protein [Planctomycetota bacterium]
MAYPQVVRVYSTYQDPDYECPWQSLVPRGSTGSGVILGPREILTGAQVVANGTFVQVQKPSDPEKVVARVAAISHDSDLALLHVEDPQFARGIRAAKIGELPRLRDQVAVVGYPVGGDEVSITEGVVSRIEVQRYEHSQRHMLAVTVDAAINDGNSGGPVFADDKVVGIAFQSLPDAENIGEMVPAPILSRFLAGVRRGRSPEVPGLGISTQNLENPALRRFFGLRPADGGVLVTTVQYGTTAWGVLQRGDVLLSIGGMPVAANGTVRYRRRFRCQFDVVVGEHFVGDRLQAVVLRDGRRRRVSMTMRPMAWLVPRYEFERMPSWFVWGGLVFQRLTAEYLRVWGEHWWDKAPKEFLHLFHAGDRTEERQEVVVLTHVLANELNRGFDHLANEVVVEVMGKKPRDLRDLVGLVTAARGDVVIRLSSGTMVLLDAREVARKGSAILQQYRVPGDRSPDLGATTGPFAGA